MKCYQKLAGATAVAAFAIGVVANSSLADVPEAMSTPNVVETSRGTFEFRDGLR